MLHHEDGNGCPIIIKQFTNANSTCSIPQLNPSVYGSLPVPALILSPDIMNRYLLVYAITAADSHLEEYIA